MNGLIHSLLVHVDFSLFMARLQSRNLNLFLFVILVEGISSTENLELDGKSGESENSGTRTEQLFDIGSSSFSPAAAYHEVWRFVMIQQRIKMKDGSA